MTVILLVSRCMDVEPRSRGIDLGSRKLRYFTVQSVLQSTFEETDMRHDQQAGPAGGAARLWCYRDAADGEKGVLHHHFNYNLPGHNTPLYSYIQLTRPEHTVSRHLQHHDK